MHTDIRRIFTIMTALALLAAAPALGLAATYYVDAAAGSDSNPGTDPSAAWKTIGHAAQYVNPGDTCMVNAGDYPEHATLDNSGDPAAPITFQAQGTAKTKGFLVQGDYIRVIGFEVTGTSPQDQEGVGIYIDGEGVEARSNYIHETSGYGVKFSDEATNSIASSNRMYRCAWGGVEVHGSKNIVERNDISHSLQHAPAANGFWDSGSPDADGIRFFGTDHIIRYNTIHDITHADPENQTPHIDCFQTWGPASNITFDGNICINPDSGMQGLMGEAQYGSSISQLIFVNNVFYAYRPLNIWDAPNSVVSNNTFVYDGSGVHAIELHRSPNSQVENNIFVNIAQDYLYIEDSDGTTIGHNLTWNSDGSKPTGTPYAGDLWGMDPLFTNRGTNDFTLQAGSPAIDAGAALPAIVTDQKGVSRPQDAGLDIGAYEFGTPAAPAAAPVEPAAAAAAPAEAAPAAAAAEPAPVAAPVAAAPAEVAAPVAAPAPVAVYVGD